MTHQCRLVLIQRPPRPCGQIKIVSLSKPKPFKTGPGDHGGIVGAKRKRRRNETGTRAVGHPLKPRPDGCVRRDTAGNGKGGFCRVQGHVPVKGPAGFFHENVAHRSLKRGGQIGLIVGSQTAMLGNTAIPCSQERRLQPREGHVASLLVEKRPGQGETPRLSPFRRGLNRWPAGLRKAQKPRGLVKRLSWRVVDRAAKPVEAVRCMHDEELAMPARHQEHEIGKRQIIGQSGRQGVPGKVVHADKGQARPCGDAFGAHHAGKHASDQARTSRDRHGINAGQVHIRLDQSLFCDDINALCMGPCGDLGNDAAKRLVQIGLAEDHR